jgi:hypothetical protein
MEGEGGAGGRKEDGRRMEGGWKEDERRMEGGWRAKNTYRMSI